MESMPGNDAPSEAWPTVTRQERNRIQVLNDQLRQTERWIDRCSRDMALGYGLATQARQVAGGLAEGVTLNATVLFLSREDTSDTRPGNDSVIARFEVPLLPGGIPDENPEAVRRHAIPVAPRDADGWCHLFLELYHRALAGNLAKLLSIDALRIEVALVQQQWLAW
ncbi:hypothetical protein CY652_13840 [Burkholderia sp. WAC0059]|uniref:hypothetical protein n=1 Tax=Burkholderia sp. WAC0059 TaxID=2066022 RepID=UPI000C7F0DF2|nr:hypothetical protein [Burkholderia sp. WAC0059]PLZ01759.1 hypothetical protein CY652_13840 [Burkholderia sp. WAC0059]